MRAFAILPAAGQSRRMRSAKLLLPWRGGVVMESVLSTWRQTAVEAVVVVVAPREVRLAELCLTAGAHVVEAPTQPPDMKASVRLGLMHIEAQFAPAADDVWLLAPADMPLLQAATVDGLIAAWRNESPSTGGAIFVASHRGRRGHPALFPWTLKDAVFELHENEGIDALLRRYQVTPVEVDDPGCLTDLDTPEDYRRAQG